MSLMAWSEVQLHALCACLSQAFVLDAQAMKAEGGDGEEATTGVIGRQWSSRAGGAGRSAKVLQMESTLRTLDGQVMEELTLQQSDPARVRSSSLEHNVRRMPPSPPHRQLVL